MTRRGGGCSFATGVGAWRASLGKVRDAVRQELVARQLAAHLPPVLDDERPGVLDLGCGQGTQALGLARRGYHVTGIDPSDELLNVARTAAAAESEDVKSRLCFERGDLLASNEELTGRFDVVCCHGVLMYLSASGKSVGMGVEAQAAAVEVDGGLEVLPVAVAAGGDPDGLDARVQTLGGGVGDAVREGGE